MTNDPAKRPSLLQRLDDCLWTKPTEECQAMLDDALAAERRATDLWWAQRFVAAHMSDPDGLKAAADLMRHANAILDAEAERG